MQNYHNQEGLNPCRKLRCTTKPFSMQTHSIYTDTSTALVQLVRFHISINPLHLKIASNQLNSELKSDHGKLGNAVVHSAMLLSKFWSSCWNYIPWYPLLIHTVQYTAPTFSSSHNSTPSSPLRFSSLHAGCYTRGPVHSLWWDCHFGRALPQCSHPSVWHRAPSTKALQLTSTIHALITRVHHETP